MNDTLNDQLWPSQDLLSSEKYSNVTTLCLLRQGDKLVFKPGNLGYV